MIPFSVFRFLSRIPFISSRLIQKELNRLFFIFLLRNFAIGMIAIFEPIYYFTYFSENITKVFLMYAFIFALAGIFSYWTIRFTGKIGLKRSIIVSFPLILIYYILLWNIHAHPIFLPLILIFWVLAGLIFWLPVNVYFGIASDRAELGSQVSKFNVLFNLSFALGPVIGGFILAQFGWSMLFATVIVLLVATSITLIVSPEIHEPYDTPFTKVLRELFDKRFFPKALAFAATGAEHTVKAFIWPIFLFVLGMRFDSIGMISAGALLVGIVFTLYVGSLADRIPRHRLLFIGSIFLAFSWVVKTFIRTPFNAFIANVFYGITSAAAVVPFMAIFYNEFQASRSHIVLMREITINIGRVVILLVFALASMYTDKLYLAFPLAALISLGFNFISHRNR